MVGPKEGPRLTDLMGTEAQSLLTAVAPSCPARHLLTSRSPPDPQCEGEGQVASSLGAVWLLGFKLASQDVAPWLFFFLCLLPPNTQLSGRGRSHTIPRFQPGE